MAEMNTPEMRRSQIKGFLRLQEEQGGIVPSRLKNGTRVLLETHQYVYQLNVLDTPTGRRYILDTASPMCRGNTVVCHIHAHSTKLKYNMDDWIGKDMRSVFKFNNGNSVMIGDVRGATIIGQNEDGDEYTYDFWES